MRPTPAGAGADHVARGGNGVFGEATVAGRSARHGLARFARVSRLTYPFLVADREAVAAEGRKRMAEHLEDGRLRRFRARGG